MSKRYWVAAFTFGIAAVIVATAYLVYDFRTYQQQHTEQRRDAADYDTENVDQYLRCIRQSSSAPWAFFRCTIDPEETGKEAERSKYDLEAQQQMAEWAYALLLVSLASTLVSLFGLGALLYSLYLNREATVAATIGANAALKSVEATEGAAADSLRAYVYVRNAYIKWSENGHPAIQLEIINAGETPAIQVRSTADIFGFDRRLLKDVIKITRSQRKCMHIVKDTDHPTFIAVHGTTKIRKDIATLIRQARARKLYTVRLSGVLTYETTLRETCEVAYAFTAAGGEIHDHTDFRMNHAVPAGPAWRVTKHEQQKQNG